MTAAVLRTCIRVPGLLAVVVFTSACASGGGGGGSGGGSSSSGDAATGRREAGAGEGGSGRSDGGSGGGGGSRGDGGTGGGGGSRGDGGTGGASDGGDAAAPRVCGPDGGLDASVPMPPAPGECRDGEAVPGCPCDTVGEERPCLTGRTIRCEPNGEFGGLWGPCLGDCFSSGTWQIDNISPCFITYSGGMIWAVSTVIRGGEAQCPMFPSMPPPRAPGEDWSPNRLTVDCEGQFRLCYTIKAGDASAPRDDDCVVARTCTEAWYGTRNATQEFPPLPGWVTEDPACARRFVEGGGYGEMSVLGRTVDCEVIDDDRGGEYVFNRVPYCPLCCNDGSCPSDPICPMCMMGGSGSF